MGPGLKRKRQQKRHTYLFVISTEIVAVHTGNPPSSRPPLPLLLYLIGALECVHTGINNYPAKDRTSTLDIGDISAPHAALDCYYIRASHRAKNQRQTLPSVLLFFFLRDSFLRTLPQKLFLVHTRPAQGLSCRCNRKHLWRFVIAPRPLPPLPSRCLTASHLAPFSS